MDVLKEVLSLIKPTRDEEFLIEKKIKDFMYKIKVKDAKAILGGSGAKGTWLRTTNDADIFILFDYSKYKDKSDKLSDILEKQLKKSFKKLIRLHGSRDYFQVKENGFTFEIVPILHIKNSKEALNITDVSPLHAVFVKNAINKNKKLADEIRLMKQFCKANRIYGAESYINGFSGYMCEVLTIYYRGFLNLIKAAAKWDKKVVIDAKNFYKGKNIMMEMNKSKTYSPMVLVDPVQPDRNAAAALGYERYNIFIEKSKEFLKKPAVNFFDDKKFDIEKLKKEFIIVEVNVLDGKEDIVGAKTLKTFEFLRKEIVSYGFDIKEYGWNWDKGPKSYFYFKIKKDLDKKSVVKGPPIKLEDFVLDFKKKHKNSFVKNGRVFANEKREFTNAYCFIKCLVKKEYVKERVKAVSLI